ncbi:galactarate dehydratase, partial [Pseudomonas soli]
MQLIEHSESPRYVRLHPDDNVVVVVNDGGLGEGARFADGLTLVEGVPQSHKVATVDIRKGEAVRRYGQVIGHALADLRQGSWVK